MGGYDTLKTTLLHNNGSVSSSFDLVVPCYGCCGVKDPYTESVILAGGHYYSGSFYYSSKRANVVRYNAGGFLEHLPDLKKSVGWQGCSMYYNNDRLPVIFFWCGAMIIYNLI